MSCLPKPTRLAVPVVFVLCALVYLASPVRQDADADYSILLSQHFLRHGDLALDRYFEAPIDESRHATLRSDGLPYHVVIAAGHVYHFYPPGRSLLSVPAVALLNAAGLSAIADDGRYDPRGERLIQDILAALLAALFVATVFSTCRILLPETTAAALSFAVAFGTQTWSTAAVGFWSHTWLIVLLGFVIRQLLADALGRRSLSPVGLGSLLALSYITRPTALIAVACVVSYVFVYRREHLARLVTTLAVWLCALVLYSMVLFESPLPGYFTRSIRFGAFGEGLAGLLVSPAKGLLVYVPIVLISVYLPVRYRAHLRSRGLAVLSAAAVGAHLISNAGFDSWGFGWSYGPRLMTDSLPWGVLLAILGVDAWRQGRTTGTRLTTERWVVAGLVAVSVFVNAAGALSKQSVLWNAYPENIDFAQQRNWDWSDPNFLAWANPRDPTSMAQAPSQWRAPPPWRKPSEAEAH